MFKKFLKVQNSKWYLMNCCPLNFENDAHLYTFIKIFRFNIAHGDKNNFNQKEATFKKRK